MLGCEMWWGQVLEARERVVGLQHFDDCLAVMLDHGQAATSDAR